MTLKRTMFTYTCLWTLADINEQKFISKKLHYDYAKTLRTATVGTFVIAPLVFNWIRIAEKLFPGKSTKVVVKKIVTEFTLFGPISVSSFFAATNILEGRGDIVEEWKEKFPSTYMTALMFWPFVQMVNFRFVSHQFRPFVVAGASFVWSTFLCFVKEEDVHPSVKFFHPVFTVSDRKQSDKDDRKS